MDEDYLLDEDDLENTGYIIQDDEDDSDDGEESASDLSSLDLDDEGESQGSPGLTSNEAKFSKAYDDIVRFTKSNTDNAIEMAATLLVAANPKHTSEKTIGDIVKDLFHKQGHHRMVNTVYTPEGPLRGDDVDVDFLGEDDASIAVSDITYGVTLKDGKYESMELSCVYAITVGAESYNITMNLGSEFSYDNVKKVTAPSDADKYQSVDFDELLG